MAKNQGTPKLVNDITKRLQVIPNICSKIMQSQKPTNKTQTQIPNTPTAPSPIPLYNTATGQHKNRKSPLLLPPWASHDPILNHPRPTHPFVWCCAIICLVICLLIIFFGLTTLIIYLITRPRYPTFNISNARLNALYFDSPENFNGHFTLLTNFTNPNRKMDIRFEYLNIELLFADRLIASQALKPFSQRPREARLELVQLISSLVYLPPNPATELQRQVLSNMVKYEIRGTFRVRAMLGVAHFSYSLHARCQLEMNSPPSGLLVARNCSIRR